MVSYVLIILYSMFKVAELVIGYMIKNPPVFIFVSVQTFLLFIITYEFNFLSSYIVDKKWINLKIQKETPKDSA